MARLQRCGAAVEWPGRRADPVVQMGMEDGDMIDANLQQVRGVVLVRAPSCVPFFARSVGALGSSVPLVVMICQGPAKRDLRGSWPDHLRRCVLVVCLDGSAMRLRGAPRLFCCQWPADVRTAKSLSWSRSPSFCPSV